MIIVIAVIILTGYRYNVLMFLIILCLNIKCLYNC